jgi:hypothetical protein
MESGRGVSVTLHRYAQPAAPGGEQAAGAGGGSSSGGGAEGRLWLVLCNALLQDGSTRVRLLLFKDTVGRGGVATVAAPCM